MAEQPAIRSRSGLQAAVDELTDGVSRLVRQHFELARSELRQEGRQLATNLLIIGGFAAVGLVGYALLNFAVVLLFGAIWDIVAMTWAAAALAVVNIVACIIAVSVASRNLDGGVDLSETTDELQRNKEWLKEIRDNSSAELPTETH